MVVTFPFAPFGGGDACHRSPSWWWWLLPLPRLVVVVVGLTPLGGCGCCPW